MGLFGKLFEKKECAICGGEIGLLGNRKLEDGNMCKKCAAKLSPWFSDRRHSTVEEIEQQLAYRAQNQEELRNFRPGRRIGEAYEMIVEERGGVPFRFVVANSSDYMEENADLIAFQDVSACSIDISESKRELKYRNDNNEMVSYNPPRYEYSYDFYVEMTIENNPYFDELRFKLNSFSVDIEPQHLGLGQLFRGNRDFDPSTNPQYRNFKKMCDEIEELVEAGRRGAPAEAPAAAAAAAPKFCPNCGAPVSGGKFCGNCGSKL